MITYIYWFVVIALAVVAFLLIKLVSDKLVFAGVVALVVLIIGWGLYFFHFQQLFVRNWGGVMAVSVPDGQRHMTATWKDNNLWIENYDPETNTCYFQEYSKGNVLEGKVTIKNCNPLRRILD